MRQDTVYHPPIYFASGFKWRFFENDNGVRLIVHNHDLRFIGGGKKLVDFERDFQQFLLQHEPDYTFPRGVILENSEIRYDFTQEEMNYLLGIRQRISTSTPALPPVIEGILTGLCHFRVEAYRGITAHNTLHNNP